MVSSGEQERYARMTTCLRYVVAGFEKAARLPAGYHEI